MLIWDVIGVIGVILAVGSYLLVLRGNLRGNGFWYPSVQAFACILVTISIIVTWNLAAFLTELSFFTISCYGLFRYLRAKRRLKK